jgi:hypothetical protein
MSLAVYTAVAGGYDDLPPHPEIPGVDFIAFAEPGTEPNGWEVYPIVADGRGQHPRMVAKWYKLHPDAALDGEYDYSIWVDASHEITTEHFANHCLAALAESDIAVYEHPWRDCIYDEAEASFDMPKYAGLPIREQVASYRAEGYPEHGGLFACGTIARRHTADQAMLGAEWWDECQTWTYQDQLSFPVVCRRLGIVPAKFPCHQVIANSWHVIRPHHRED